VIGRGGRVRSCAGPRAAEPAHERALRFFLVTRGLLDAGADPNAETERGYPVSMFAASGAMRARLRQRGAHG
jgi:hypothetical protein